jgi:hypothetical protein
LTVGHSFGSASQLTLSYEPSWRFYDSDAALTVTGEPIPDSHRQRLLHNVRLAWRRDWDEAKHWRSNVTLGARVNQENGGGYSDYTGGSATAQLRYRTARWQASAEGRIAHYDYRNQTVSSTDPAMRRRTEWSAGFRVERQFGKHLAVAASYDHEETLSNDVWETYSVNTVAGSVQWEF